MARQPWTQWSDTDHAGPMLITTIISLVYWLVPGIGQQFLSFGRSGVFAWADILYVASMVAGIVQAALVIAACANGLGKSTSVLRPEHAIEALRLYHASNVLYVLVLGLAKCSAACSIAVLTVPKSRSIKFAARRNKIILAVIALLATTWMIGSIITLGVECNDEHDSMKSLKQCDGTMPTWAGIFAGDAVTDLIVTGYAASIIMPTKARFPLKVLWYTPFFIRLGVVVLSGARLASFHPTSVMKDPTLSIWLFVVLTQCQIFFALIASGFPAVKRTVLDMDTNLGVNQDSSWKGSRITRGVGYMMSPLASKNSSSQQPAPQDVQPLFDPQVTPSRGNSVKITTGAGNLRGDNARQNGGIVRRTEIDVFDESSATRTR